MAIQEVKSVHALINKKPDGLFYAGWILLTLLCVPAAFVISLGILGVIARFVGDFIYVNGVQHITQDYLSLYLFFPLVGLLTGLAQYGLLRGILPHMGGWVLATTVGWMPAMILAVPPSWPGLTLVSPVDLIFLLIGLGTGVAQWLLLRSRLPRAGWWVAASLLGWGLLALITTGDAMDQFGLFSMSLLPACVTAVALRWLLRLV